jgi:membrane-bound ClpP family serine protease
MVRFHGELWKAVSQMPVAAGQVLEVKSREGLTLLVTPSGPERGAVTSIREQRRKQIA